MGTMSVQNVLGKNKNVASRQDKGVFQRRFVVLTSLLLLLAVVTLWPTSAYAQPTQPTDKLMAGGALTAPSGPTPAVLDKSA